VEGDLDLQKILKPISISKKRALMKKVVVMKKVKKQKIIGWMVKYYTSFL
jgi:hypothetical protein